MKYIVASTISVAVVFLASFLVCGLIRRRLRKKPPLAVHVSIAILSGIALTIALFCAFLSTYYPAEEAALRLLSGGDGFTVTDQGDYLFVDGSGEETALVFYPGAKIESEAYLPLMVKLAQNGIDGFLIKPPLHFALLDANAAGRIMEAYPYERFLVCGHSLGGFVASSFAASHPSETDSLVLLGSYPMADVDDPVRLLTVYGSEDRVLDWNEYEKSKTHFPVHAEELRIEGGNHAGFGNYGVQKVDGEAKIPGDEQQDITVSAIMAFLEER